MAADPRLLTHPAIRREAERLAREWWDAAYQMVPASHRDEYEPWNDGEDCRAAVAVIASLLSDPSRPETRDALVRMGQAATGPALGPLDSTPNWHALRDDPNALVREFLAVVPNE